MENPKLKCLPKAKIKNWCFSCLQKNGFYFSSPLLFLWGREKKRVLITSLSYNCRQTNIHQETLL